MFNYKIYIKVHAQRFSKIYKLPPGTRAFMDELLFGYLRIIFDEHPIWMFKKSHYLVDATVSQLDSDRSAEDIFDIMEKDGWKKENY